MMMHLGLLRVGEHAEHRQVIRMNTEWANQLSAGLSMRR